jgi:hypothetical protein
LDAVHNALFWEVALLPAQRAEAAAWIADRQGLPGSYAGMFAPTGYDYSFGTLTFTGEPVRSSASTGHILSEEACRALYLLGSRTPEVTEALRKAREGLFRRMEQSEAQGQWAGVYCCGACSVALWRHLSASGEADDALRMDNGLEALRQHRDGAGRWKRFPFFYALLALLDLPQPAARAELAYAAPVMDRALRRLNKAAPEALDRHALRRKQVMERALERC